MDLSLPTEGLKNYKSASQQARVCTEPWGAANLYCPACESPRLESLRANTPAHDFKCPSCLSWFQLKSKSSAFGRRVQDGAFDTMRRSIAEDRTPSLFLLQYLRPEFVVRNVLLIPHFVFSESMLERRKPLSPTAERAGWVGCNFLLDRIPPDARIDVVHDGKPTLASDVRRAYERLRPLESLKLEKRGWTLDVLEVVSSLSKKEFSLADVYARENNLAELHPNNAHVRDKIRQQLQILRDLGFVEFLGRGKFRLHEAER
jgi:type II restriction enzyme